MKSTLTQITVNKMDKFDVNEADARLQTGYPIGVIAASFDLTVTQLKQVLYTQANYSKVVLDGL